MSEQDSIKRVLVLLMHVNASGVTTPKSVRRPGKPLTLNGLPLEKGFNPKGDISMVVYNFRQGERFLSEADPEMDFRGVMFHLVGVKKVRTLHDEDVKSVTRIGKTSRTIFLTTQGNGIPSYLRSVAIWFNTGELRILTVCDTEEGLQVLFQEVDELNPVRRTMVRLPRVKVLSEADLCCFNPVLYTNSAKVNKRRGSSAPRGRQRMAA